MGRLLVIRDGARPGADNMAADAELLARRAPGDPPVLRLYRWSPPAVSYGYHQAPDDFDREVIDRRGWGLVRRPTGGRAILHAQELTYAVVGDAPSARFGDDLHAVYAAINGALTEFLRRLGLSPDISQGRAWPRPAAPSASSPPAATR
ncbi:MAG: lipoate--protein ligase family protein [bacterium]|nr:lipoate--protein ligase family protein [bacterium]